MLVFRKINILVELSIQKCMILIETAKNGQRYNDTK